LKAHYPLEYFTVALSLYSGDMDRTANLISEMNYFGIELKPIKFRHSNANYNIEKETNSIYKGVGAVKYCNEEVGNKLYELRNQQFDSFIDLLEVFPGNSRQREILIKLGYFEEFAGTLKLLKLCDLYDLYHGKKQLKKDKLGLPLDLVQKYAISETAKQFRFDGRSMDSLLREFADMIPDGEIPLRTRLEAEAEYLGYISYTNPKLQNTAFVLGVDVKYSPKITVYHLDTGTTAVYKLAKQAYQKQPFDKGNIIKFYTQEKPKSKLVDGEWIKTSEMESWVSNYIVVQTL
jgi:DNA polymerase-3 subunit alpha